MKMELSVQGLDKVRAQIAQLQGPALRSAMVKGINDTAYMARGKVQQEMDRVFDRVTPWIRRSPKVFEATPEDLSAYIAPTLHTDRNAFVRGGKVGVDPQDVLQAQAYGKSRADKRSEAVLRRAGVLPQGWQTAIPDEARGGPFPGSVDAYGNIKGPFIRSVLSYLQTYAEQGHRQNMKPAAKQRVGAFGRGTISKRAQAQAGPFMGRRYFVSYGKEASPYGEGINRADGGLKRGKPQSRHIGPGIWAVQGVGKEAKVRAVLIFTKPGYYTPRFDLEAVARRLDLSEYMARRLRFRIREAAGV